MISEPDLIDRLLRATGSAQNALGLTHRCSPSGHPHPNHLTTNSSAPDLIPFLHTLASASPSQFGQAKEYFRRAAELEGEHELQGRGEGKRWFELVRCPHPITASHPTSTDLIDFGDSA